MKTWYKAHVYNVVDGDTFDAKVDIGFGMTKDLRVRLANIDTAETWRPQNEEERIHGQKATDRVTELILNKDIWIFFEGTGSFGRHLGTVWLEDEDNYLYKILIEEDLEKRDEY